MNLPIAFTPELTNTQFAPLAVLLALYQQDHWLDSLRTVQIGMRQRVFDPASKLIQVLLGILAGGETLYAANPCLKQELSLARVGGWTHFADQSSLSRTLDALTLKHLDQLRSCVNAIRTAHSQITQRDWRSFLWIDFDLTPLPCGPQAEASLRGYFGEKKSPGTAVSPLQCHCGA
jgi:hypothetical protein